ncbi:MAG: Glycosyltransferase/rhamnosyltransferase [uncultured bacterium]|nr:MAG: Glycosyltransferase/rhamnosyltransferase [uncultured bacterium]KKT01743.1 MAG: glycosyltransferase [Candidatus Peregrinibacteria bacterium GW2011_GWF2_43_17]KKT20658.1 MAG: hypothetical protein UW03_C0001G0028 [Candidatus Peregrinibacteria bacterium GW2011_GWA2_43_8]HAU39347.1 hypothetical protein [Candidatus Peregrinibacteria bacterium]
MKLSITLVNFNQKYFPRMCVESLRKSETDFDYEIIVVDNNSSDESLHYLEKAHNEGTITLIKSQKNLGYGRANNLAAKNAKGEYILIMNEDITVEKDTLQKMVDFMDRHKDIGILAPKLIYHSGHTQESCRRFMTFWDLVVKRTPLRYVQPFKKRYENYLMKDFDHNKTQEVDLLVGAFLLMSKKVFDEVDGFDERFFLFLEDFDLCRKVKKHGYKIIYYPEVEAVHYHKRLSEGSIFGQLTKGIFWIHVLSSLKYFWKWRRP